MKEKKIFHVAHVTESPSADAGFSRLYPKADGWYTQDSAGNEVRIEGIVVLDNAGTALDQKPKIQFLSPLTTAVDGDKIVISVDTEGHSWEDAGTTPDGIKPVLDKDVHVSKLFALEIDLGSVGDLETYLGTLESWWEVSGNNIITKSGKGIKVVDSFEVDALGDIYAHQLSPGAGIAPKQLFVTETGKIIRDGQITEVADLTFEVQASSPVSGHIVLIDETGGTHGAIIESNHAYFYNLQSGVYQYMSVIANYHNLTGSVTMAGVNQFLPLVPQQFEWQDEGDVIEGRRGIRYAAGTAGELTLAKPTAVADLDDVNFSFSTPDAADAKTVELSARKSGTGGSLTLITNDLFNLDGATGNVLTTTVKGAWVKVKSIDIDGTDTWMVIMDSGDWIVDTIP